MSEPDTNKKEQANVDFVGETGIRDRTGMASPYSDVVDSEPPAAAAVKPNLHTPRKLVLLNILVVLFGLIASTCIPLFSLVSQNWWIIEGASVAFALLAIALAYKNYIAGNGISPLTIVGLGAAAIAVSNAISALAVSRIYEAFIS